MDKILGTLYVCDREGINAEPLNADDAPYTREDADLCDVDPDGQGVRLRAATADDDCSPSVDFVAVDPDGNVCGYFKFVEV